MGEAGIPASCIEFCVRQLFTAGESEAITAPDRDVAGGILIEKSVVEEMAAPGDRRAGRDQRHFAQMPRALVCVDQLLQDGLILLRADLGDLSVCKGHLEILDQAAAIAKWKRRRDGAV